MHYLYTSLLATDDYIGGIVGLYLSLQNVKSKYPLKVIVLDTIKTDTISILDNYGISYEIVKTNMFYANKGKHNFSYTINKFACLQGTSYNKILFLDADIIVLQNIDNMFLLDAPRAIPVENSPWFGGYAMLLVPNFDIGKQILELQYNLDIYTDEHLLNNYLTKIYQIKTLPIQDALFHDCTNGNCGARYKYWGRLHINTSNAKSILLDFIYNKIIGEKYENSGVN